MFRFMWRRRKGLPTRAPGDEIFGPPGTLRGYRFWRLGRWGRQGALVLERLLLVLAALAGLVFAGLVGLHLANSFGVGGGVSAVPRDVRTLMSCPGNSWDLLSRSKSEDEQLNGLGLSDGGLVERYCDGTIELGQVGERSDGPEPEQVPPGSQGGETRPATPTAIVVEERPAWMSDTTLAERAIQGEVNSYRSHSGLRGLDYSRDVAAVARGHSIRMAEAGFFAHVDPVRGDVDRRFEGTAFLCGENIASTPRATSSTRSGGVVISRENDILKMSTTELARYVVQQWIDSPGHEENMRGPDYTLGGVGVHYQEAAEDLYATHNLCFRG